MTETPDWPHTRASARPGPEEGYAACAAASDGPVELGRVGAGTGAMVDKWRGFEHARPAGIGSAVERDGEPSAGYWSPESRATRCRS